MKTFSCQMQMCLYVNILFSSAWNDFPQLQEDSPPAWTQEAYGPPRSKYSSAVPPQGVTHSWLGGVPHPWPGGVSHSWPGGTPVTRVSPWKDMGPVEVLWDGDGVAPRPPPPPRSPCQPLPIQLLHGQKFRNSIFFLLYAGPMCFLFYFFLSRHSF